MKAGKRAEVGAIPGERGREIRLRREGGGVGLFHGRRAALVFLCPGFGGFQGGGAHVIDEVREGAEGFGGFGVAVGPASGLGGDLSEDDANLVAVFDPGFAEELNELFGRGEQLVTPIVLGLELEGTRHLVGVDSAGFDLVGREARQGGDSLGKAAPDLGFALNLLGREVDGDDIGGVDGHIADSGVLGIAHRLECSSLAGARGIALVRCAWMGAHRRRCVWVLICQCAGIDFVQGGMRAQALEGSGWNGSRLASRGNAHEREGRGARGRRSGGSKP